MDHSTTLDQINDILDDPRYAAILNSSGWPITKCINTTTKTEFLQCLIHNEVVQKRLKSVQSFCQGLEHLKVVTLLRKNPDLMKPVFLFQWHQALTSDVFLSLVSTPKPKEQKLKVYWFVEYVQSESRKATLGQLLQFCTGLKCIPPMGLKDCITIKFLTDSPLPMAEACFATIRLPIIHSDEETFIKLDHYTVLDKHRYIHVTTGIYS